MASGTAKERRGGGVWQLNRKNNDRKKSCRIQLKIEERLVNGFFYVFISVLFLVLCKLKFRFYFIFFAGRAAESVAVELIRGDLDFRFIWREWLDATCYWYWNEI